jgi:hypothetical protein
MSNVMSWVEDTFVALGRAWGTQHGPLPPSVNRGLLLLTFADLNRKTVRLTACQIVSLREFSADGAYGELMEGSRLAERFSALDWRANGEVVRLILKLVLGEGGGWCTVAERSLVRSSSPASPAQQPNESPVKLWAELPSAARIEAARNDRSALLEIPAPSGNPVRNVGSIVNALQQWLVFLAGRVDAVGGYSIELDDRLGIALKTVAEDLNRISASQGNHLRTDELLWWGEARYCHTFQVPFRKLPRARLQWVGCLEGAYRSREMDARPSASFVVATLERGGLDVSRTMSLGDWVRTSYDELRSDPELIGLLPAGELFDLALKRRHGCVGLPVVHLLNRIRRSEIAPSDEDIRAVHVEPEQVVDLGDWITFIFMEFRLALSMEVGRPGSKQ